jgi:hypothetical protein
MGFRDRVEIIQALPPFQYQTISTVGRHGVVTSEGEISGLDK